LTVVSRDGGGRLTPGRWATSCRTHSRIQEDHLKSELLTRQELEIAAHRQGFASLRDVDRAVIEPGGGIFFTGKKPTTDETQQSELVKRLDAIAAQLNEIRSRMEPLGK